MADCDLVIRHARAVLPGRGLVEADLALANGRIAALLAPGARISAAAELDARGLVVMPGAIDVHLHLGHGKDISRPRVPDDAAQETAAAAVGGITMLRAVSDGDRAVRDDLRRHQGCHRTGRPHRFRLSLHHFDGRPACRRAALRARLWRAELQDFHEQSRRRRHAARPSRYRRRVPVAAVRGGRRQWRHGLPASGNDRARLRAARARQGARPAGHGRLKTWNATRPPFVEADAVQRAAYIAHVAGAPLYVVHTSSAEALDAALRLRRAGATVFIETCPHYLTHDETGRAATSARSTRRFARRPTAKHCGRRTRRARSTRSRPITSIAICRRRPAASGPRRRDVPASRRSCRC